MPRLGDAVRHRLNQLDGQERQCSVEVLLLYTCFFLGPLERTLWISRVGSDHWELPGGKLENVFRVRRVGEGFTIWCSGRRNLFTLILCSFLGACGTVTCAWQEFATRLFYALVAVLAHFWALAGRECIQRLSY